MKILSQFFLMIILFNVHGDADAGIFFFRVGSALEDTSGSEVVSKITHLGSDSSFSVGEHQCPLDRVPHDPWDCHACHLGHCSFMLGKASSDRNPHEVESRIVVSIDRPTLRLLLGGVERPPRS